jgi:HSP20 family protein
MPGVLTRWDPYGEFAEWRSRFERMFGDLSPDSGRKWMPAIDVERRDGTLIMRADMPGVKPEEISIEVEDEMLTISGKHEEATEEKDKHYLRRERRYGFFSRSIALPAGVDVHKISADTHEGVLEVKIPLPEEVTEQKKVTITPKAA